MQTWLPLTIGVLVIAAAVIVWQRQQLNRAHYDVTHDPTTGVGNRRAVISLLRPALCRGRPTGLVVLDSGPVQDRQRHLRPRVRQ